jgi:uncharacterized protein (UPF0179 family)
VTVRVTEDGTPTLNNFETIDITVGEVNQAPVLAEIGNQSIEEGSLLTFATSATDADLPANNLSFSLDSGAPAGATIDSITGEFSWTPGESQGPAVHSVTVRVTDDGTPSLDDFRTFDITVDEVNQPPILAEIGNKSVDEGSLLTFTALAIDPDLPASDFSFSLDSGAPAGATINSITGEFSWTPPGGASPGDHTVTVRVSEDGVPSLEDFETITITVNDVNLPPVLDLIGAQRVDEGSRLTFTASATDPDQPADQLSFSLDSDAPAGATIDPTTGEFTWTPDEAQGPAVHLVTVRVTDDGTPALDDFQTINITVGEVNQAPVLAAIGDKSVDEGSLLTFTVSATDPDSPANNLSFSLDAGAPLGASIDPSTGQFSWTPPGGTSPGDHTVTVRVSDDGLPSMEDFVTFTITVNDVNLPPVLAAIGTKIVGEGSLLTFTASATDPDLPADNFSFSLDSDAPAGATIHPTTGEFNWTPPELDRPAVYSVTVRVTDDGTPSLEDFETVNITVSEVNLAPVLAAIGNQNVDEGSLLTFTASATDANLPANNLSFSLASGAPAGATIDSTTGEFNWTPDEAEGPAVYSVTVRVTDDGLPSLDDFETFDITVGEANQAPALAVIGNRSVEEGSLLTFTASAIDPDLPASNFSFSLDAGAPLGATIDPTTGEFRWTPPGGASLGNHTVTVRVTDDGLPSLDDFETITITVNDVNLPPVLAAIGGQSVDEGSPLTFTASATDPDLPADNLSFSLDAGAPTGATINSITGEFTWTPPGGTSLGNHTVTVRVSDDSLPSLDDFETITITVNDVNLPPVLAAIGGQSVEEGSPLTFTASATDLDTPADNFSFSLDSGAPAGATIHPTTGEFNWTPGEVEGPAVYPVTVRVTEDGTPTLNNFETINITVGEVNQAPVLAAIGDQSIDEGSLLTFTASATDADLPANNLTFSLDSDAPAGATIHPTTGEFSWTPGEAQGPAVHSVTVRVTDGDGTSSLDDFETINITVGEVNQAPELAAIGNRIVDEGSLLTFMASAIDPDLPASNLSFSLDSGAPAGATIDSATGEFNWTPSFLDHPAVYSVTVRVTEEGTPNLEDFETINITVSEVNRAPELVVIGNKSVDEGSLLTFTASATDADLPANKFAFSLDSGAPAGATIDSTTGVFSWTPTEAEGPAVHSVTVRVTDDGVPSLEDFETINITVGEVNQAPVLAAIGNRSVDEGSLLTFTVSATDADFPANNLSFSLDAGAPLGATIDPSTGQFSWTPPGGTSPGDHMVTVQVSDDGLPSLDDFETFTITVNDVNLAPVLATIGGQSIDEGSLLTFTASATDADLPANNLSFSLDSGAPAGATINPATGEFNWTPAEVEGPAVYSVTVRVTDDETPSLNDFETVNIMVSEVNRPPVLATIGNKSVDEGSPLTFTASATDVNLPVNNLSFTLDAGAPLGATIDPSTGQFSWTPPGGTSPGNHTVTVRVTDDGLPSMEDFETITITVNDVNLQPVLAAIGAQSVQEGSPLTFTASATDPDLPANNLSFSLDPSAPLSATIDPSTGEFSWTPGEAYGSAVFSVTVRVTDDGVPSRDDFETINITVREVNQAPVLAAIGDKGINEGSLLTFTASATDPDLPANNLSYSLDSDAPAGATIHPTTGEFNWTPTEADGSAVHSVTVRVTEDGRPSLDDFETINITVGEVNQAPVLAAIGNKRINEGSLLTFTASATDPDLPADNFSFSLASGAPAGATINASTGEFSWTPDETRGSAVYSVTVRVTDDGVPSLDDFETINITVGEVNQAPELAAIGNRSIDEGSLLSFTASATDADLPANNLSFSLDAGAPLGATIDPSTGQFSWTPPEGTSLGNHTVTVRVSDDGVPSLDDFETINITLTTLPPPRDPLDVNRDGRVSALDALAIINQISRMLSNDSESLAGSVGQDLSDYDANGDGRISALDALLVINHISATNQEAESTVDSVIPTLEAVAPASQSSLDDDLIRLLANDNIIARLAEGFTEQ